jgi:hypothetical protein
VPVKVGVIFTAVPEKVGLDTAPVILMVLVIYP